MQQLKCCLVLKKHDWHTTKMPGVRKFPGRPPPKTVFFYQIEAKLITFFSVAHTSVRAHNYKD